MDLGIKGKYALVTAASRGIGRATALALADEGCNVAICARNIEKLETVAGEIRKRGVQAIAVQADVTVAPDIDRVFGRIRSGWGALHILVNNAGGVIPQPPGGIEEVSDDYWMKIYDLNARAAIRFTNLAVPFMRKKKWGRVVTVSSKQGKEGGGKPWYTMAKSAEIAMMKTMAMSFELARDGITFNSVAPGAILTEEGNWADFLKKDPEKLKKRLEETFPMARLGQPEEVAAAIVFLCSAPASLVTGACVPVDGAESKAY